METSGPQRLPQPARAALETSLVEWKLRFCAPGLAGSDTLETSLVEWKLVSHSAEYPLFRRLGNFLSGMETTIRGGRRLVAAFLGNFLSGMETPGGLRGPDGRFGLGNFLSGMETRHRGGKSGYPFLPWKLP